MSEPEQRTSKHHLSPPTEFERGRYGWPDLFWATGDMPYNHAMAWCEHHRARAGHFERMLQLRTAEPPSAGYSVPRDAMDQIYETLKFYANLCSYEGARTGGVLAGCPRGPNPTPADLVVNAQEALWMLDRDVLGRLPVTKNEYRVPSSTPAGETAAAAASESTADPSIDDEQHTDSLIEKLESVVAGETKACLCQNMRINTPMGIDCPDCGRPL